MRHLQISSVLCCMSLCAGAATAADKLPSASDCFVKAFKAADADAVAACYVEDGIIWFPGGPMAQGRPAIKEGFGHYFSAMTIKDVSLTDIGHVMGDGNTRTAWGTYEIHMVDKTSGAEVVQRGRFTDVSKEIDGRWLYVVDHPSDDPAPAAAK